jgi:hypothetical protein
MTSLGAFRGTVNGMGIELGIEQKDLKQVFDQLFRKSLVKVDERAFLWWCPNFLKYNSPENPNVVKGWFQALEMLPECPLLAEVLSCAIMVAREKFPNNNSVLDACKSLERVIASLSKDLGEEFGQPFNHVFRIQEQEQEQDIYPQTPKGASSASEVSPSPAKKERKKNPEAVAEAQRPDEVTEEAWAAWMQVRKDKNAKHFSVYAFNLFKAECEKAGITLQKAVETCIAHHWASYRVEYQTSATNRNTGRFERSDEDNPFLVKNLKPRKQDDGEFDPEVMAALRKGMKG